jgi:hypothetical protein
MEHGTEGPSGVRRRVAALSIRVLPKWGDLSCPLQAIYRGRPNACRQYIVADQMADGRRLPAPKGRFRLAQGEALGIAGRHEKEP